MSDLPKKPAAGCKVVGCGCLILTLLTSVLVGTAVFFSLRAISSGKIEAHHFIPRDSAGTITLHLNKKDQGLAAVYSLILEEILDLEGTDIPPWLESLLPDLSSSDSFEGPTGPRVVISLPPRIRPDSTYPLFIMDLNSYSRAAAAALQISLKTSTAALASQTTYKNLTLYEGKVEGVDFAMHKGFLLAAGDVNLLKSGIDALEAARASEWPDAASQPEDCDLYAEWTGDFSALAASVHPLLDPEAATEAHDIETANDLTRAELCIDVITSDRLTFLLRVETETSEKALRVAADLQEHMGELQSKLKESHLKSPFTIRTEALAVILEGELAGLDPYLRERLRETWALQDEPISAQ